MFEKRKPIYPRALVRFCFFLLSEAHANNEKTPFSDEFTKSVLDKVFPKIEVGNEKK
jgi:hypothetical protein